MISLTEAAIAYVKKRIEKEKGVAFRVLVKPSGCSNLKYHVGIVDKVPENDLEFLQPEGVRVCTDPQSYPFIKGLMIDYVFEGMTGKYQYDNPNEKGSCGCGVSFSV